MKKTGLALLVIIAGTTIYSLFETPFAENTIDYFSFFAGLFLILEAGYKIIKHPEKIFPIQSSRLIRVVLGTCIFTIHFLQLRGQVSN